MATGLPVRKSIAIKERRLEKEWDKSNEKNDPRISRYDLPIEFHFASIKNLENRPSKRHSTISSTSRRHSVFKHMNPDVLLKRLETHREFSAARNLALHQLLNDIYKTIALLVYMGEKSGESAKIPNRLFSWSEEDFFQRCQSKHTVWLEVLQKSVTANQLDIEKFKFDLHELKRYITLIFKALEGQYQYDNYGKNVYNNVQNALKFLNIEHESHLMLQNNQNILRTEMETTRLLDVEDLGSEFEAKRLLVGGQLINESIRETIEVRYEINMIEEKVNQVQYRYAVAVDRHTDEIDLMKYRIEKETYTFASQMDMHYMLLEQYKREITHFTQKYDNDVGELDSKVLMKHLALDKLRSREKFLISEIERFHFEIERRYAKEATMRLAEERRRMVKLEAQSLKALRTEEKRREARAQKKAAKLAKSAEMMPKTLRTKG